MEKLLASDKTTDSDKQSEDADSQRQSVKSLTKEIDHNLTEEDITNWMNEDSIDPVYQVFTDEEIVQQILSPSAEEAQATTKL